MSLRLPALEWAPLSTEPEKLARDLRALSDSAPEHGYVQVQQGDKATLLFLFGRRVFGAGSYEDGRFRAIPPSQFADVVREGATSAMFGTCDLPLFLCSAVTFHKPPSAHVPASLVDGSALLDRVAGLGKDAVLAVQRGSARTLAFCKGGVPVAAYAARDEAFPAGDDVPERLLDYIYTSEGADEIVIDLYDDVRVPRDESAGAPIAAYLDAQAPAEGYASLVVHMGGGVVFQMPITKDETIIGRGDDVDLVLEHPTVSRLHARAFKKPGKRLLVEDLHSENGVVVDGERKASVELAPGQRFSVGEYDVLLAGDIAEVDAPRERPKTASPFTSSMETLAIGSKDEHPLLEKDGETIPVKGVVFTIGSDEDAGVRIKGLRVASSHIVLRRSKSGWDLLHNDGRMKVLVNGEAVKERALHDGDVIELGSHKLTFRVPGAS
jgi:pSer/pThr/pTyr-binding forkhead associated (FHA) protein